MRAHLFWIIVIVVGTVLLVDRPVHSVQRLFGQEPKQDLQTRQPVSGLGVVIDYAARRQGRRVAVLMDDWLYCYPPTGEVFLVPSGYETDFASIPGAARGIINPFGDHAEAAVIHDWLYAVGESDSRPSADGIFRYAMKEQGVNIVRRNAMHRAVRMGGNTAYGREEEWRFRDPRTLNDAPEPFPRPEKAAVETIDCENLGREMFDILSEHGTHTR